MTPTTGRPLATLPSLPAVAANRPRPEIRRTTDRTQIVAARAGDIIQEFALAIDRRINLGDLASSIHVYPTYATGIQQLAAEVRLESAAHSRLLKLARGLSNLRRS